MLQRRHAQTRKPRLSRANADKYALYIESVQAPDVDVLFYRRVYRQANSAEPRVFREDFCGTAAICCAWVQSHPENIAHGIDLDPEPLAWGRKHHFSQLSAAEQKRVHLHQTDVLSAKTPKADVIAAQNFSYYIFKTRAELRHYFETARRGLAKNGLFLVDLFGGSEVQDADHEDITQHKDFQYVWHQESFDPVSYAARFHIHFRFRDKTELRRAFSYDWRLWTIPEVRELMAEAGFKRTEVYWEGTDRKTNEGNGVFRSRSKGDADPAWNAYVIGFI